MLFAPRHNAGAPTGAFGDEVARRVACSGLAASAVAHAAGIPVAFLDGRDARRIPLDWVAAIATATGSDVRSLKRLWAEEYAPDVAARLVPREVSSVWIDTLGPVPR
jgi:hypothetical protein